jgi:translation elongation factor EF-G
MKRQQWTGWFQEQERGITITSAATTCGIFQYARVLPETLLTHSFNIY